MRYIQFMGMEIGHGFVDVERERVADLYWQAFGRKLRPAFASVENGQAVVAASLSSDRTLVAREDGAVVGMCGYRAGGRGAVAPTWRLLRAQFSWLAAARAAIVLATLERSDVDGVLVLDGICVDDSSRGRGTGTALLEAAADYAAAEGLRAVRLAVVDSNPRAEALYRRRGFVPVGSGSMGMLASVYGFDRYTSMERRVSG